MNRNHAARTILTLCLFATAVLSAQVPAVWRSRGVGAGGALYSPSINPANDHEYYLASDMSELYHTTDFGNSYSIVNFTQIQGGHESAVRFTSNPLIAYSVTYTGGNNAMPAKTADGGATWSVLSGNPLPGDDVYSIWTDYNNPNRVVVAGYSQLYFSANGGTSFTPVSVTVDTSNGVLVCGAFFDGNNIYLGTNAGLLVSANGGTSFTNAGTPGIPAGELMLSFTGAKVGAQLRFFCLTVQSSYPGIDLGSDYYGNFRGIYSLQNGAGNWTAAATGIDPANDFLLSVAMAQNDLNTVYAAGGGSAGVPEIFKTTNAGGMWTNTFHTASNQNINTGWSGTGGDRGWGYGEVVFGLAVAPGNSARAVFTDYGFAHRTSDGGATWQQAYVSVADQHPVNTTAIAGGSYHSIGLEDTSAWQVVWSDAQHLFAGFSDIKGVRSSDRGVTWTLNYTGHNGNTMYRLLKHPASGALYAATSDIHDMYQSTRLADNPLNNADANGKVLVSTDRGASWSTVHSFGHPVFWLAVDPTNTNRMYASVVHSTAGGVFVTTNLQNGATSTWTKLANPPRTEGHPASITVLNDGKVVCTYSGHRNPGFTASSGVFLYDPNTQTWTDVSDPGMLYWTKDLVLDPADATQNTWYVGVFSGWGGPPNGLGGLYRTTDRGAHWAKINLLDRVTSITFSPRNSSEAFLTTETDGLWHAKNIHAVSPTFSLVANYPFRQPERVFFNPYNASEIWVTSFGNGLMVGNLATHSDFDGDAKSDVLWHNAGTGLVAAWTSGAGYATFGNEGGNWAVIGRGDFDGDGKSDVLWRNASTGLVAAWTSTGGFTTFGTEGGGWAVSSTGDFDGDGRTDVLWRNTSTGLVAAWTSGAGFSTFGTEGGDWSVISAGECDYDGDGKADVLWRNASTGQVASWTSGGGFKTFGVEGGGWAAIGAGDYDGDGKADVLWRNTSTGLVASWTSGGSFTTFGVESGGWTAVGSGDFDGDGRTDVLWLNTSTGLVAAWTSGAGYMTFGTQDSAWSMLAD